MCIVLLACRVCFLSLHDTNICDVLYLTEARYLLTSGDVYIDTENGYVEFEKLYEEDGVCIYRMQY